MTDDTNGNAAISDLPHQHQRDLAHSLDVEHDNLNSVPTFKPQSADSLPSPQQQQQTAAAAVTSTMLPSPAKVKLDQAVRFWMHPSLGNVSSDEKLNYLRHRIGLTDDEIHGVWDRVLQDETESSHTTNPPSLQRNQPLQTQQSNPPLNASTLVHSQRPPITTSHVVPPTYPSWPTSSPYYPQPPEMNAPTHPGMVPLWLTLGGFLGVAAAAAVRWLNGGDFCLFPPPQLLSVPSNAMQDEPVASEPEHGRLSSSNQQLGQPCLPEDYETDYDLLEEEETSPMANGVKHQQEESWLARQVQSLTQTMETHVRFQERLLQVLANETTNRSMNLLVSKNTNEKANDTPETKALLLLLWTKLVEIRVELSNLHLTLASSAATTTAIGRTSQEDDGAVQRIQHTLDELESCIRQLNNTSTMTIATNSEAVQVGVKSDADITAVPQLQQQIQNELDVTEQPDDMLPLRDLPSLKDVIRTLAENNFPAALRVGAKLLYLYVIHLLSNPHVPRYRKIFTANESFAKVQQLQGGVDLLRAVGFVERDNCWEWQSSEHDNHPNYKDALLERLREAAAALSILKSPTQNSESPEQTTAAALAVVANETTVANGDEERNRKSVTLSPSTPFTPTSFRSSASSSSTTPLPHSQGQSRDVDSPFAFQTPQPATNNIISPPTTKKHPFLSPEEFTSEPSRPPMPQEVLNDDTENQESIVAATQATASKQSPRFPSMGDDENEQSGKELGTTTVTVSDDNNVSSQNSSSPAAVTDHQIDSGDVSATGKRLVFDIANEGLDTSVSDLVIKLQSYSE